MRYPHLYIKLKNSNVENYKMVDYIKTPNGHIEAELQFDTFGKFSKFLKHFIDKEFDPWSEPIPFTSNRKINEYLDLDKENYVQSIELTQNTYPNPGASTYKAYIEIV